MSIGSREAPLVSVLIPCFNAGKFIRETLDCVLAQTWPNLEIIVVDDGSTDESSRIVSEYAGRGVRLIEQSKGGASAARNRAFRASSGRFVQFLDADDLISPQKIEQQVRRLSGDPVTIASCAWGRFAQSRDDVKLDPEPVWRDLPALDWLAISREQGLGMMFPAIWLIPRDLIERSGLWLEELSLNDDTEFFTRLLTHAERVLFCEKSEAYYRSGVAGSLSGSKTPAAWRSAFRVHELCEKHLLEAEGSERMRDAASLSWQQFAFACYAHEPELAEEALARSRKLSDKKMSFPERGIFVKVAAIVGWKSARRIQHWWRGGRA